MNDPRWMSRDERNAIPVYASDDETTTNLSRVLASHAAADDRIAALEALLASSAFDETAVTDWLEAHGLVAVPKELAEAACWMAVEMLNDALFRADGIMELVRDSILTAKKLSGMDASVKMLHRWIGVAQRDVKSILDSLPNITIQEGAHGD